MRTLEPTTRRERLSAWMGVAGLLFVATLLPYLYAWTTAAPEVVFLGLAFDVPDHAQYWAWVTASRDGLFISNTMTPEPNPPIFLNPMMWLLAKLQQVTALDLASLFQVWRFTAILVVVLACVWLTRELVEDVHRRRTARWVMLLGGGLGWLLIVVKTLWRLPDAPFPHDLYTVEPNTFWAMLSYPYLALAQGLVALTLAAVWWAHRSPRPPRFGVVAVCGFVLGATHAYDLVIVYAVLSVTIAALVLRHRSIPWSFAAASALVLVVSLPIALYYRHLTVATPLWRSILAQYGNAGVWTPSPPHLLILLGIPLILAVPGALARWRKSDEDLFVVVWAVVGLVLPYAPVVFQIKLLTGWQFPLAILATHAWHDGVRRLVAGRLPPPTLSMPVASIAGLMLVALVIPTNLYLYGWRVLDFSRGSTPYFAHRDEMEALAWIARHGTAGDVVLAREEFGRLVPGYAGARSVLAHWAMTNRYFERRDAVTRFFSPEMDEGARDEMIRAEGVTLVVWSHAPGPGSAPLDPGGSPNRVLVFERPRARVYAVR